MEIIKNNLNIVRFIDLDLGDVFINNNTDEIFMKIQKVGDFNAVNIESGLLNEIAGYERVKKLNCTLTID